PAVWQLALPRKLEGGATLLSSVCGDQGLPVRVSVSPLASWDATRTARPELIQSLQVAPEKRERHDFAALHVAYLLGTAADADAFTGYKALQRESLECRGGKAWQQVTGAVPPPTWREVPRGTGRDARRADRV